MSNTIISQEESVPAITDAAKARFEVLHREAGQVVKTLNAGRALREIKEENLFKIMYESWTAYCENVLDLTLQRAQQLISAANRADWLTTEAGFAETVVPETERALRLLVGLEKEEAAKVLKMAIENAGNKRPTYNVLMTTIQQVLSDKGSVKGTKKRIKVIEVADLMFAALNNAPAEQYSIASVRRLKKLAKVLESKISALEKDDDEEILDIVVAEVGEE